MRKGHRQSDEHWNRFKGNVGETSERRDEAHVGSSERIDTILNWTELNWNELLFCNLKKGVFFNLLLSPVPNNLMVSVDVKRRVFTY